MTRGVDGYRIVKIGKIVDNTFGGIRGNHVGIRRVLGSIPASCVHDQTSAAGAEWAAIKERFDRRDASGFQEVEDISPITGQKIRTTRFVEQEQFTYELDILFLDGHTGALRLRDRLSRGAVFRGQANDPITAFYQLSEAVAGDVLAVVAPRTREEMRILFRG